MLLSPKKAGIYGAFENRSPRPHIENLSGDTVGHWCGGDASSLGLRWGCLVLEGDGATQQRPLGAAACYARAFC